ncbi:group II intron maturase-specific domain-containing protein [Bacillus sp. WLY-B-L8]|uniref:group II intron maturase-specific domain-containing protein n=1 Tax=Bacillus multifaciens TaxID=3068506 RepID=UPI00274276BB|nr:group II intron maturase-specific domain-containing protein [Bacillus sp. WLY-B-L8]
MMAYYAFILSAPTDEGCCFPGSQIPWLDIQKYTEPRNKLYLQLNELVKGLNRILQGFENYYSLSPIVQKWLSKIDWYVLERLNLFWNKQRNIRKKHGRFKNVIKKIPYTLVKVGS